MKKSNLNASKLRWILVGSVAAALLGGGFGVFYLHGLLADQMKQTNDVKTQAANSSLSLTEAQSLQQFLKKFDSDVKKTALIVSDTSFYKYQNQIVEDISRYAKIAGVTVLGYDFPIKLPNAKPTSSTGLNSMAANITLASPVPFQNYLTFIKLIEQNLTKMQITDLSISPDKKNPSLITNNTIGIEVFTK